MDNTQTNVNPSEVDKFSALASKWWDPNSEFKPLHEINPLRLNWIEDQAGPLKGKNIVDVGCGGGILTESLAKKEAQLTGIDLSDKSLTIARLHSLESKLDIDYKKISVEQLAAERAEQYDIVTCMELLEHVPNPGSVITACAQLVKPGGRVFFSTLNRNPKSFLFAILGAEYILNLVPKGTHDHKSFIKPSELYQYIREAKLTLDSIMGLNYNLLNKSYYLSNDATVNYMVACTKL